ncbi:MAG: OmpA family protein [Methyloglobulus sp.]|nr:OmpA family protein [Methyloglobulus sp.]
MAEQPIIKKVIKKKGHGHHGGAWKLAYADFVTAMMAFFLLMWLLGSTDEATKKGISEYFQDPYEASKIDKGKVPSLDEIDPTELDKQAEKEDKKQLESLKMKIEKMVKEDKNLGDLKDQIQLTITPEGLRVQIVDDKKTPMFKLGSSKTEPQIRTILNALAPVINKLPNKITINGHTDAKPFPDISKQYTNWELSSERANAARAELRSGGYDEKKILRVSGLGDSVPLNTKDPLDPVNRRISIIVMNKKTELQLLEEVGNKEDPKGKPAPPEHGGAEAAKPGAEKPAEPSAEGADKAASHEPEKPAAEPANPEPAAPKPEAGATPEANAEAADNAATQEPEKPAAEPAKTEAEPKPADEKPPEH